MGNIENLSCKYTVSSWADCRSLFAALDKWIFRGQSNSSWPLTTTLERGAEYSQFRNSDLAAVEEVMLRKFQRKAPQYLNHAPPIDNYLEWLSIIQHHGGPTRLLDFTYSFYIAMYFSLERATEDSVIYCLNKDLVYQSGFNNEKKSQGVPKNEGFGSIEYLNKALGNKIIKPFVVVSEPFIMNERLSAQQGLFAMPLDVTKTFECNLAQTMLPELEQLPEEKELKAYKKKMEILNDECFLLKVVIPRCLHKEIKLDLKKMNITSTTLLPGIDGFAKSLYDDFEERDTKNTFDRPNLLNQLFSGWW